MTEAPRSRFGLAAEPVFDPADRKPLRARRAQDGIERIVEAADQRQAASRRGQQAGADDGGIVPRHVGDHQALDCRTGEQCRQPAALDLRQRAAPGIEAFDVISQSAPMNAAMSSSLRPEATSSAATAMSMP